LSPSPEAATTGFLWHPKARLFDGKAEVPPAQDGATLSVAQTSGALIRAALAMVGKPFRIGGEGPLAAGPGQFETLTSGSSGAPRHILRTMASWQASFAVNAELFAIGPGTRVAVLGRMEHSLALYGALEGLQLGALVHLLDAFRPDRQRAELARGKIEVLYATPAQLRLMVEAGGPVLGLRLILVGGSKLDIALRHAVGEMAPGAELREFYGAAEASFISLSAPDMPADSVGIAYPGVQIRIAQGEIWVKSPYLFLGYAGAPAQTVRWQDGWLSVGEMGRQEAGFLYLSGRAGRMVTVADQNVFPEEIEAFIAQLPGVTRVAVLPRPDRLRGMHLIAVIQGEVSGEGAILAACRARLGPLKAPKAVVWRSDWPVLASGKTDLQALARGVE
jgi:long-chain acyl-CoA synthetase